MKNVIQALTRIAQHVSLASSPDQQVVAMVTSISETMAVDVCSLYLLDEQGDLLLLASRGLAARAVGMVRVPKGEGLVGLVVETRHPINLADAQCHPGYRYVPETEEERFHGFCAVPVVFGGKVIGVLVVQTRKKRQFSEDEEGFLVTLGAQLAMPLVNYPVLLNRAEAGRIKGVKGAPGVAIGYSCWCDTGELFDIPDEPCRDIAAAIAEWRTLLATTALQIEQEKADLGEELGDEISGIFGAYKMLLKDPAFTSEVEQRINAGNWLPGALKHTVQHIADVFLMMDDPYLRARHEDIHHLGNKLLKVWRGGKPPEYHRERDLILVGHQVSISDIATIPSERLKGILCFNGSGLSHTAILANALGIPALMGTGLVHGLEEGRLLIVDGDQGRAYLNPGRVLLSEYRKIVAENRAFSEQLKQLKDTPAQTRDGQLLHLYANTGLLTDITPGLNNGAEGVGLYRTEIPFLVRDTFPTEDEQTAVYRQVLKAYAGKPVYMRTLDIGGDKQLPYFPINGESNPALGWRGIRFSLDNSQLLMTQVRAMLRASEGVDNLHILLPMVSSIQEIEDFRDILDDALKQLQEEGRQIHQPPLGVMIEVPALVAQIGFLAGRIDFLSIGSNDLSQYLLALDRDNPRVAFRYDHLHPAVLHEIKRILHSAKGAGLPVSLCGEMASDPYAVVLLLGMGLRTLSMSAAKLPYIKWLLTHLSAAAAQDIADQALQTTDVADIRTLVGEEIRRIGLVELLR